MPLKITFDTLYKLSLFVGIAIIIASTFISRDRYQALQISLSGILEQIILTRLDIISLSEQHTAVINGLKLNKTQNKEPASEFSYSKSQIEQLRQEEQALKFQIESSSNKLKELEYLKDEIRDNTEALIILTITSTVFGCMLAIIGCFGWVYHVKIFQERRDNERVSDEQ